VMAMDFLDYFWGHGKSLTSFQMMIRAVVVFIVALFLIRLSGRRSFGMKTALDNIIVILLGAILSRAVVGASPFLPILAASFVIALMHRAFSWLKMKIPASGEIMEGKRILLYEDQTFIHVNMNKALVSEEDILQEVRLIKGTENLDKITKIYMEKNGEISVVEK
jgi:uncharacterized membrane protein YcaP (DUF421 family)